MPTILEVLAPLLFVRPNGTQNQRPSVTTSIKMNGVLGTRVRDTIEQYASELWGEHKAAVRNGWRYRGRNNMAADRSKGRLGWRVSRCWVLDWDLIPSQVMGVTYKTIDFFIILAWRVSVSAYNFSLKKIPITCNRNKNVYNLSVEYN